MNMKTYDKELKEIDFDTWTKLMSDPDYKSIWDNEDDKFIVFTIWIWLSSNPDDKLIFETMVFSKDRGCRDDYIGRYSSYSEAVDWHTIACMQYLSNKNNDESK